jgi:phosphoribosyl-ATP pyrophosphohydrolase
MTDSVSRLYQAVLACRHDDPSTSRTARLLRSGRSKMAKKLAEEAVEVVIDAMHGDRDAVVKESAERLLGIAEKVPKKLHEDFPRRKIVVLEGRRARKRR